MALIWSRDIPQGGEDEYESSTMSKKFTSHKS